MARIESAGMIPAMAVCAALLPGAAHAGLQINVTYEAGLSASVKAAFNTVVGYFEKLITNDITVNVDVQSTTSGLAASGGMVAPGAVSYAEFRTALGATATSAAGRAAYGALPSTDPLTAAGVSLTYANAKALGFVTTPLAGYDGTLYFNTGEPFQYADTLHGATVASGNYDFVSTAEHELDHVLGLVSALDTAPTTRRVPRNPSAYDFFRFDTSGNHSYTFNPNAAAFFAPDGLVTASSPRFNQDGNGDYSDWYSPTAPGSRPGRPQDAYAYPGHAYGPLSAAEIAALGSIGYNFAAPAKAAPVPLPPAIWLFTGAVAAIAAPRPAAARSRRPAV